MKDIVYIFLIILIIVGAVSLQIKPKTVIEYRDNVRTVIKWKKAKSCTLRYAVPVYLKPDTVRDTITDIRIIYKDTSLFAYTDSLMFEKPVNLGIYFLPSQEQFKYNITQKNLPIVYRYKAEPFYKDEVLWGVLGFSAGILLMKK